MTDLTDEKEKTMSNNVENKWVSSSGDPWTMDEFLEKLDSEGGLTDMILWGGPGVFPPAWREMAATTEQLITAIDDYD